MNTSIKNKTIFASINIVCLFVTLAFPNSSTPLSIIPVIVSVSYWIYSAGYDTEMQDDNRLKIVTYIFLVIALILAMVCCIVGFTHEISAEEQDVQADIEANMQNEHGDENDELAASTKYVITPKSRYGISVSMPNNYNYFAFFIVLLVFALSVGDIVCEWVCFNRKITSTSPHQDGGGSEYDRLYRRTIEQHD